MTGQPGAGREGPGAGREARGKHRAPLIPVLVIHPSSFNLHPFSRVLRPSPAPRPHAANLSPGLSPAKGEGPILGHFNLSPGLSSARGEAPILGRLFYRPAFFVLRPAPRLNPGATAERTPLKRAADSRNGSVSIRVGSADLCASAVGFSLVLRPPYFVPYCAVHPPSTNKAAPVVKPARSELR